jgi:LysR family glycine cleavage system transcriptional activator
VPPLLSLRAFEAAAAHLSFQRAALELSVTPSAISHQVRALEDTLGQPLFRRLTRQLALTPAGQRLFEDLRMGFDVLEAGVDKLRRPAASQAVTLTTNTAFAARWVLPRMEAFRRPAPASSCGCMRATRWSTWRVATPTSRCARAAATGRDWCRAN